MGRARPGRNATEERHSKTPVGLCRQKPQCTRRRAASRGHRICGKELKFNADAFVHELVDSIIGDQYPSPDRMLVHAERVVHEYLAKEMCGGKAPAGKFDIFAVEGGTAAMCYIFDSLLVNHLLHRGDKVALAVPTFTPYIEICHLDRFHFDIVEINASEVTAGDGTAYLAISRCGDRQTQRSIHQSTVLC